jgi:hypothetical protein
MADLDAGRNWRIRPSFVGAMEANTTSAEIAGHSWPQAEAVDRALDHAAVESLGDSLPFLIHAAVRSRDPSCRFVA